MSATIKHCELDIPSDLEFAASDLDGLFAASWKLIRYTGAIVIRRDVWLAREKEKYYGSYWTDVCVIFQERLPGPSILLSRKLISVRMENQSWLSKWFEVFCVSWPRLVRGFPLSKEVQQLACTEAPWENLYFLVLARAAGQYSIVEYHEHVQPQLQSRRKKLLALAVSVLPGVILNTYFVLRYSRVKGTSKRTELLLLTHSKFCLRRWRAAEGSGLVGCNS